MLSLFRQTTDAKKPSPAVARGFNPLWVLLAAVMLGALLVFLIVSNFLAQRELQDLSLRNLRQDLEKRAAAVSYFYAERETT